MFSSPSASPANRPLRPRPFHSNRCHPERSEGSAFRLSLLCELSVSAFSSPDVSSFNLKLSIEDPGPVGTVNSLFNFCPFNFELSTFNSSSLSPFPATLTDDSQLAENPATLSPVPATLTTRVNHNPFVCHSYKIHPEWGPAIVNFFVAQTPQQLRNLSILPVPRHESSVRVAVLFLPPVTSHQSQVTKSFTIRTYARSAPNPFRIRTSKTKDLNSFRIRTYEKNPRGTGPNEA